MYLQAESFQCCWERPVYWITSIICLWLRLLPVQLTSDFLQPPPLFSKQPPPLLFLHAQRGYFPQPFSFLRWCWSFGCLVLEERVSQGCWQKGENMQRWLDKDYSRLLDSGTVPRTTSFICSSFGVVFQLLLFTPVMAQPGSSQDTLAVPVKQLHQGDQTGLNEDLVRILRENLLQQERHRRPRGRKSPSSVSPRLSPTTLSPRNSPRLLRRMLINNNIHKQRRFTVAHTW